MAMSPRKMMAMSKDMAKAAKMMMGGEAKTKKMRGGGMAKKGFATGGAAMKKKGFARGGAAKKMSKGGRA